MAYKIAFIGGGSALWTARLSADMFLEKSLNGSEIVLVDIDPMSMIVTEKYLQDFLRSDLIPIHSESGRMHIWGLVDKYDSVLSWTEEEWQKGFVEKAVESLQKYVVETDEMVERFLKYIQSV